MWRISYLFITIIFMSCSSKMEEKTVNMNEAEKDGFEIIILNNKNKIYTIRYGDIDKSYSSKIQYLIPKMMINNLSKEIENSKSNLNYFIHTDVKIINKDKQEICLEYHYSKSTYIYCYQATTNSVIPKYSKYHDFSRNEKVYYE